MYLWCRLLNDHLALVVLASNLQLPSSRFALLIASDILQCTCAKCNGLRFTFAISRLTSNVLGLTLCLYPENSHVVPSFSFSHSMSVCMVCVCSAFTTCLKVHFACCCVCVCLHLPIFLQPVFFLSTHGSCASYRLHFTLCVIQLYLGCSLCTFDAFQLFFSFLSVKRCPFLVCLAGIFWNVETVDAMSGCVRTFRERRMPHHLKTTLVHLGQLGILLFALFKLYD